MSRTHRIAIIPARGGSKRLPRKNILPINGKPMISYPIRTALQSNLFDEVVVSTEDDKISDIAEEYGATVFKRPEELAQDRSTVVEVCVHLLKLSPFTNVDSFCCIYATAVLLQSADLIHSSKMLYEEPIADFVMGVSQYNYHPAKAMRCDKDYLQPMWPEYSKKQSQFLPEVVVSNGTLYWARRKVFLTEKTFVGSRTKGYIVPEKHAIDIDTVDDYEKAKEKAASMDRD